MEIIKANCAIKFKRVLNLDGNYIKIQKILGDGFKELSPTPFQDNAPAELPRYVSKSYYGHSELLIALNQVVLNITFDEIYNKDTNKVFTYFKKRIELASKISELLSDSFEFSGVSLTVKFDNESVSNLFLANLNSQQTKMCEGEIYEYNHKYAFIKNKYQYLNIAFLNATIESKITKKDSYNKIEYNHNLIVNIDVNDKHGFNYIRHYKSNMKNIDENYNMIKDIVINKLSLIVEGEKVKL